jgi:hypothetical protein
MNKTVLTIIVIIGIVLVIRFIQKIIWRNVRFIFDYPRNAKKQLIVQAKTLQPSKNEGISWTLSFWIYIDNWDYLYTSPKRIIHWHNNAYVWLSKKRNDLNIQIPVDNRSNSQEYILFKSVPIQKWIHCCVILENRYVDLWMNGKLYHSKKLSGVPKFNYTKEMYVTPSFGKDKGFSGYISRFRYYNIPIKKNTIQYLYRDGPINRNPIPRLIGYFKKIAGSIKFNVKVDVDIDT